MTLGKNKGLAKKGKNLRKVERHAFLKKEWFKLITAPTFGNPRPAGWVPGNTTIGKKRAEENVIGRVCELAYSDIEVSRKDQTAKQSQNWRKVKMEVEKVEGGNLYTSFNGLGCTREKIMSLLKKRLTIIEVMADVKTVDGFILRVFVMLLTKPAINQTRTNCYAQTSQIRAIRKDVITHLTQKAAKATVDNFAREILADSIPEEITKVAGRTHPIRISLVTKVKVLKKSKIDLGKLVEDSQTKGTMDIVAAENPQAQNVLSKEVAEQKTDK
jgi:small subunit ribosomal protein S3Ae